MTLLKLILKHIKGNPFKIITFRFRHLKLGLGKFLLLFLFEMLFSLITTTTIFYSIGMVYLIWEWLNSGKDTSALLPILLMPVNDLSSALKSSVIDLLSLPNLNISSYLKGELNSSSSIKYCSYGLLMLLHHNVVYIYSCWDPSFRNLNSILTFMEQYYLSRDFFPNDTYSLLGYLLVKPVIEIIRLPYDLIMN